VADAHDVTRLILNSVGGPGAPRLRAYEVMALEGATPFVEPDEAQRGIKRGANPSLTVPLMHPKV
jgi:hypothetical protein